MSVNVVKHQILGTDDGNFDVKNPAIPLLNVGAVLSIARKKLGLDNIIAPRCNFTNNIVEIGPEIEKALPNDVTWFLRTKKEADGIIVNAPFDAVAIFNADCPIVAVHDLGADKLAVLHAGFRCLVPPNQKRTKERSIIRVLFEDHGFNPWESDVFFGYGIGPCCFGVTSDKYPEIDDFELDIPYGKVTRGSRLGKKSIDIYQLILNQLLNCGVQEKSISADMTCTACAGIYEPKYYSVTRFNDDRVGRNASLAWMAYAN